MTTTAVDPTGGGNPFTGLVQGGPISSANNPINSIVGGATGGGDNSSAAGQVSSAYNTFIKLLTAQLQHQDPLNPTNTDTFTQELIQLSGVEQQLTTNQTLSQINNDLTTITQANGLGYVGKTVTVPGSVSPLQNGKAQWEYSLDSAAHKTTLNVKDSGGNTIFTSDGSLTSGDHPFSWDGTQSDGTKAPAGDYTLEVVASDANGQPITTTVSMVGQVTGVDTSTGTTQLEVGDIKVPVDKVNSINS